jgi:hypothetical protein
MSKDVRSNSSSLAGCGLHIEAVVDAAKDPRVVDVIGDLLPTRVVEHHVRHQRVSEGDGMSIRAEDVLEDATSRGAEAPMPGRIARERRCENQRLPVRIALGLAIGVRIAGPDSRHRPPEVVEILGIKPRACECV